MALIVSLLLILCLFALGIIVYGLFMPNSWMIEQAVLLKITPTELFSFIEDLKSWEEWTVWNSKETKKLELQYPQHSKGLGAEQLWSSNSISGTLLITKHEAPKAIEYTFHVQNGSFTIEGILVLDSADIQYTQLAWRCKLASIPQNNPLKKYQAFFLKNYFDSSMNRSLKKLEKMLNK